MNWADERYVRLYVRDTITWLRWDWRARTVFVHMLRKVDRSGVIEIEPEDIEGLAALLMLPTDIVEAGMVQLVKTGTVERTPSAFVMPKFIEAQETRQSDMLRQRASRERRRENVRSSVTSSDAQVTDVTGPPSGVTPSVPSEPSEPAVPSELSSKVASRKRAARSRAEPKPKVPGLQSAIDAFHDAFHTAYGSKPTWGAKSAAMLKRLVAQHGVEVVRARIAVLFTSPPAWLRPPHDIGTLVQHFDKLVPLAPSRRTSNGAHGRFEPTDDLDYGTPPWEAGR